MPGDDDLAGTGDLVEAFNLVRHRADCLFYLQPFQQCHCEEQSDEAISLKGQVAQMVRAFGLHPKGRGFNSFTAHQFFALQNIQRTVNYPFIYGVVV